MYGGWVGGGCCGGPARATVSNSTLSLQLLFYGWSTSTCTERYYNVLVGSTLQISISDETLIH